MNRARHLLNTELATLLYNALVLPCLSYCLVIWGSNYASSLHPLITVQKRAIRVVAGTGRLAHTSPIFRQLRILKLPDLLKYCILLFLHDRLLGHLPPVLSNMFTFYTQSRTTRSHQHFSETVHLTNGSVAPNYRHFDYRLFSLFCQAPRVWNNVIASRAANMQDIPRSKGLFKKCVRLLFIDEY